MNEFVKAKAAIRHLMGKQGRFSAEQLYAEYALPVLPMFRALSDFVSCQELFEESPRARDFSQMWFITPAAAVDPTLIRTPDGRINNCALAFGAAEAACQICMGKCPDGPGSKKPPTRK